MQTQVQYVNDSKGNLQSVLLPVKEWKKLLNKIRTFEQQQKVKNDLTKALKEVQLMETGKIRKRSFKELLDEL
ncbi:MAG: hypothetical protein ABI723_18090 [Bacteroidia bacterium]